MTTAWGQAAPIVLDPTNFPLDPSQNAVWWSSSKEELQPYSLPTDDAAVFSPLPKNNNFGFSSDVKQIYFGLTQQNAEIDDWILELSFAQLDSIEFATSSDGLNWYVQLSGDSRPQADRAIKHRYHVFRIPLKDSEVTHVLIRVASSTRLTIPLQLWPENEYFQENSLVDLLHGLYFGALLSLAMYNAFLYPTVKDRSYLYYVLYLLTMLGFQLSLDGYAALYLWPSSAWIADRAPTLFLSLCLFFGLEFARLMTSAESYCPIHNRLIKWFRPITLIPFILLLIGGNPGHSLTLLISLSAITTILIINSIIITLRRGHNLSLYLLIAFSALIPGIVILLLTNFDILSSGPWAKYVLQVGTFLEAILLSMALAYRINELESARSKSMQKNLELEREICTSQSLFTQKLLTTQDLERKRISIELHDGIGQNLAVISNQVKALETEGQPTVGRIRDEIAHTINNVRNITHDLHPHILDKLGLESALQSTVYKVFSPLNLNYHLETVPELDSISQKNQLHLYRIVQELTHNAVKHSASSSVSIEFSSTDDRLFLRYSDNGLGQLITRSGELSGLGMGSIKERVRAMGGVFEHDRHGSKGFHINIVIPRTDLDGN